ncbi:autotransporter domain-containing protein [Bradyrhizobium sp. U87765 SZCCT0131]|nr:MULTISPECIES: autotransporter domain-containing protein [unclassified Bradyrhizobium]MBR1219726.1 autotransporter domain-containing protein [Bradyrhizobium sp. U87765 SZCCT0131]MBR1262377.1 autotransporter domain-containing protein [Bradyrhizobium sp. U87765 SZCCT0134]MBR1308440.1 autotransporter domain-containing protein [Bradyrhizobium sp. U87765 SZCCT0110]MBR1318159.1 autotransporter domain-containing protein [Bradyrhizobium sp. U87765 SZCCT0109]MBR1351862.1 autotransporter domain-contai
MLAAQPAFADGGTGGAPGFNGFGGTAGTSASPNGGNGSVSGVGGFGGGGGGGGGVSYVTGLGGTHGNGGAALGGNGTGGDGGDGGNFGFVGGTSVVATPTPTAGSNGADSHAASNTGGGGGGGGAGGGGALLTGSGAGSTGVAVAGANGGSGGSSASADNPSGSGGGGGDGGVGIVRTGVGTFTIAGSGSATGGNGGIGGNSGDSTHNRSGNGGNGGGGGAGVVLTNGGSLTVSTGGHVTGGNGAAGGNTGNAHTPAGVGGNGGTGGTGILLTSGGGTTVAITVSGTITGGNGGSAGIISGPANQVTNGTAGAGGAGIAGANVGIVISGGTVSGGFANNGAGVQANAITFTGGVNVLELQAGSTISGNVVAFSNADAFRLGGAANASFDASQIGASAQYDGFGLFQKSGSGTWTLTGTNSAALPWSVDAGTLLVNGTLANATMVVKGGATLGGTGTVGATTVSAGGIFAPGSGAPGTAMTVNGSLAFASGAFYAVALNPSTASSANVAGAATLGGATVNATFAGGSHVSRQYTILTAGSISGTFGAFSNSNLPANFSNTLSYDATHAYLNLTLNFAPSPPATPVQNFGNGLNLNQNAVGNALINVFNTTGGIPIVYGTLTPAGLTQASGELATGAQQATFGAMNQFMGLLIDPFIAGRGDPVTAAGGATGYADEQTRARNQNDALAAIARKAPAADVFAQRWSVWAAGYGGSQATSGNAVIGSNTATSSLYGAAAGADYRLSPDTLAGFALAGGGTAFSVANGLGSGRSDLFQAGAFVRHTIGAAYVSGAIAYGWQDITTNRTVTVAGIDQLRAQFNANAWSGRLESGYRVVSQGIGLTPYAAAQFTTFDLPAYAEQALAGASAFALAYGARSVTATRSELGLRTDKSFALDDGILALRGRAAWAHDFNPDRTIGATFQALPGASFVVNGARQASDAALVTASVEKKWLNGWSAATTFEGEFSSVTTSYAGKGAVRYSW